MIKKKEKKFFKISLFDGHKLLNVIFGIVTFFVFFCIIYLTQIFQVSWHNVDLSYNTALLTNDVNIIMNKYINQSIRTRAVLLNYRQIQDRYEINETDYLTTFYINSSKNIPKVYYLSLIFSCLLGLLMGYHYWGEQLSDIEKALLKKELEVQKWQKKKN